jgi:hypothetical protein
MPKYIKYDEEQELSQEEQDIVFNRIQTQDRIKLRKQMLSEFTQLSLAGQLRVVDRLEKEVAREILEDSKYDL